MATLDNMPGSPLTLLFFVILATAVLSAGIIWMIRPLLLKHALAKPNARSSHRTPTPQGAGIAVIGATLLVAGIFAGWVTTTDMNISVVLFGATLFIAVVGFADDLKSIPVPPRLALQALAVAAILLTTSADLRIVPACPLWIERGLIFLASLWFVNLVNFMDGLDWMTVVEVVPITGALVSFGLLGGLSMSTTIVAAALCGGVIGFAPFNRPVAKIFLGDVGSLPIGLVLGWCLLQLAWHQQPVAALLLPLYYLSDATATLLRRIFRGEPFWAAHRSHFYQRATDNGFTVLRVVSEVFALNIGLAALATISIMTQSAMVKTLLLVVGGVATAALMYRFSQKHRLRA
jgi:UDP-N-acetylmuramyl pentapeptide phosphotransferase/UDP-N-acetylglucosamine-1-phosphate transferase